MHGFDNLNISFHVQATGFRSFPGRAIEPALRSGMGSKMGSFQWNCVEYKGHNGFVKVNFSRRGRPTNAAGKAPCGAGLLAGLPVEGD